MKSGVRTPFVFPVWTSEGRALVVRAATCSENGLFYYKERPVDLNCDRGAGLSRLKDECIASFELTLTTGNRLCRPELFNDAVQLIHRFAIAYALPPTFR